MRGSREVQVKVPELLQKIDAAAETALFDVAPRLARRAGLVLAFLVLGLLTAGIYRQPPAAAVPVIATPAN